MTALDFPRSRARFSLRPGVPWKAVRIVAFYLALLGAWKVVAALEIWPTYTFPLPEDVFEDLRLLVKDGVLWDAIQTTMQRMAIGYSLSIVIGLFIGISMGTFRWVDEAVGSLVLGLQSLPSITWFPLAILWFGLSENAIIFVFLMG